MHKELALPELRDGHARYYVYDPGGNTLYVKDDLAAITDRDFRILRDIIEDPSRIKAGVLGIRGDVIVHVLKLDGALPAATQQELNNDELEVEIF